MSESADACVVTAGEHVLTAHLQGEAVLLDMESKNYYQLNETAACVWSGIERGLSREALVAELCTKFDVDTATAEAGVGGLLDACRARGLVRAGGTPGAGA